MRRTQLDTSVLKTENSVSNPSGIPFPDRLETELSVSNFDFFCSVPTISSIIIRKIWLDSEVPFERKLNIFKIIIHVQKLKNHFKMGYSDHLFFGKACLRESLSLGLRLLLGRYEKKYTIARGIENAINREWESS